MQLSRRLRVVLVGSSGCLLVLIYVPILLIVLYAFNPSKSQKWPVTGLTLQWIQAAIGNPGARSALVLSVQVGLIATGIALVLGSLLAAAVHRHRFFGRNVVSFLVILPVALPGIVTGIALNTTFRTLFGGLSLFTLIVGHATFCVVTVYNNVIARMRRTPGSLVEASADLGADPLQTFRFVTLPVIRSALIAGALLAFALSFDEVIVTTFTAGAQNTLPLWIFGAIRLGQQLPEVNAVVVFVLALTIIPVAISVRLTGGGGVTRSSVRAASGPGDHDGD
jgi:putative spermidine/putrescine transport system permease protein